MPTDVLCSQVDEHSLPHLHKNHPSSDSVLHKPALNQKPQESSMDTNGLLKNTRSASLPLKILLNEGGVRRSKPPPPTTNYRFADLNEKLIRSWNGMDTFLMNQLANKSNNENTNFILYARFSLSEHFLNLIGESQDQRRRLDAEREREESSPPMTESATSKNELENSNQNYFDDDDDDEDEDEDVTGSSPLISESSTLGGEDVVQFVLDTDEDNLSRNVTNTTSSTPVDHMLSNDINNNERCVRQEDDTFEDEGEGTFDDEDGGITADDELDANISDADRIDNTTGESILDTTNNNNNDLDQTITYEKLNDEDESATSSGDRNSNSSMENLIENLTKTSLTESPTIRHELNRQTTSSPVPTETALNAEETLNFDQNDSQNIVSSNISIEEGSSNNESGFNSLASSSTLAETSSRTEEPTTPTLKTSLSWSLGSTESSSMMNTSGTTDEDEDDIFKNFMPKKSCLKKHDQHRNQLYIDTSGMYASENATSSPLVPATPTSPMSSSTSSSPLFSSSSSSFQSPSNSSSASSHHSDMSRSKKRVSFADVCGKDLFTIRTMSEPSNCPPKLTSKIVQFFLNREFNHQQQQQQSLKSCYGRINDYMWPNSNEFFSHARNYGYGISTSNYSNDLNKLAGSIAVYSLNFAQPAADYFKFRQKIAEKSLSLENVVLNRFQINGTIKVKNLHFNKSVFVRCSFDNWATYNDYPAIYTPLEYYSSGGSMLSTSNTLLSSPTSSSFSAAFYGSSEHHSSGASSFIQARHKEFDTFRFEFELPKSPTNISGAENSPNASIQFCICYRTGDSNEYWDNNEGKNYEILQYVIDIESLKPQCKSSASDYTSSKSRNFKYEGVNSRAPNNLITQAAGPESTSDVYY